MQKKPIFERPEKNIECVMSKNKQNRPEFRVPAGELRSFVNNGAAAFAEPVFVDVVHDLPAAGAGGAFGGFDVEGNVLAPEGPVPVLADFEPGDDEDLPEVAVEFGEEVFHPAFRIDHEFCVEALPDDLGRPRFFESLEDGLAEGQEAVVAVLEIRIRKCRDGHVEEVGVRFFPMGEYQNPNLLRLRR